MMKKTHFSILQQKYIFTAVGVFLALLAMLTPFKQVLDPDAHVGGLLIWAGLLEIYHGFRRAEKPARMSAWFSGSITLLIGILLVNAELFQQDALINIVLFLFIVDASRYLILFVKKKNSGEPSLGYLLSGIGNIIVVALILVFQGKGYAWMVGVGGTLRILGTVYSLYTSKMGSVDTVADDVIESLGIEDNPKLEALAQEVEKDDNKRASADSMWIAVLLLTLFFIHLGRMGLDRTSLGIISPLVAVIGDVFVALVIAYGLIAPFRVIFRKLNSFFINSLSKWVFKVPESEWSFFSLRKPAKWWVTYQIHLLVIMRKSGYSFAVAIRNGLKIGLPFAAVLAAITPVLGMSWYFDTENWASGIWDGYAGVRTVAWREAIVEASGENTGPDAFRLHPEGVPEAGDFSFVVIGDTGEGDPSQLVLKDQLLKVVNRPDIRFLVISSDIIYPSGSMRDYERKFYLPFKGIDKPIYAIPGNHDWYDALEGFVANFFTPEAAVKAMEARIRVDNNLTLTNSEDVQELVHQAKYLREQYRLPVGYQDAPFFQIATDDFVLLAVDTGIRRRLDKYQLEWVRSVLEASKGKYVMVLLGHPFYAAGEYQGNLTPDFRALHGLLREYKVPLVMAGDTHDLEYYREPASDGSNYTMHHFVNGGGGAYLSIGAALTEPDDRPVADWANYPAPEPLIRKIDSLTPGWKMPAWIWVKKYDGYPFSAEWLSAAFDYNHAPYFQSFLEIRVEKSKNRIRLIPYGINGQLHWSDFQYAGKGKPDGAGNDDLAEWILPMFPG